MNYAHQRMIALGALCPLLRPIPSAMPQPDAEFSTPSPPQAGPTAVDAGAANLERQLAERTAELQRANVTLAIQAAQQRESQSYFEKSFHASPALMGISRLADRRIKEANPAFFRACGYSRDEVIDRTPDSGVGSGVQMLLFYTSTSDLRAVAQMAPYHISYSGPAGWYYIYIYTASDYSSTSAYTLTVTYP